MMIHHRLPIAYASRRASIAGVDPQITQIIVVTVGFGAGREGDLLTTACVNA